MRISTEEARKKLGCNRVTLERGLRQGKFPFGEAILNEKTGTWTYLVYDGALNYYMEKGKRYEGVAS